VHETLNIQDRIADPIKFKRVHTHRTAHSQTQHVDVLGIKYEKLLHLWLDIIIISCGDNACNLQIVFFAQQKLSRHHNYSLTLD